MQDHWSRNRQPPKGLLDRLDRAAGNMNAYLLVIAIGLAALDFTCFWIFQARKALPPSGRTGANAAINSAPAGQNNSFASVKSARSAGAMPGF
jgi:hypothetical protein